MGCGATTARKCPPHTAATSAAAPGTEKKDDGLPEAALLQDDGLQEAALLQDDGLQEAAALVEWHEEPPRAANKSGMYLRQIEELRDENLEWLESKRYNKFADRHLRPTMYDVVPHLIKPKTADRKCSYAELFPEAEPHAFVSHWWGEEFVLFVSALRNFAEVLIETEKDARQRRLPSMPFPGVDDDISEVKDDKKEKEEAELEDPADVIFWVCSFANRQWKVNLGTTLEESPFEIALADQMCKYVVMVMDPNATPLSRIWCLYEVLRSHSLEKAFDIATENGVLTHGRKEVRGKERQDLLHLCQLVLEIDAQNASASCDEDRKSILAAIKKAVGVEQFSIHLKTILVKAVMRRGGNQLLADAPGIRKQLFKLHQFKETFVYFGPRSRLHQLAEHGTVSELVAHICGQEGDELGVNTALGNGQTPLHLAAAFNSDPEVLRVLIEAAADMNCRDKQCLLPMGAAALRGQTQAVKLLLESGAVIYTSSAENKEVGMGRDQRDPLVDAILGAHKEVALLLIEARAELNGIKLVLSCLHDDATILRAILRGGVHPDDGDDRASPLLKAAELGNGNCIDALLEERADVNLANRRDGQTPLIGAAIGGYPDLVQKLLDHRADMWAQDREKRKAFDFACGGGFVDVVGMLIEKRADINQKCCKEDFLPIHMASMWGRPHVVRLLAEHGSEINEVCGDYGQTPLMYGAEHGYLEVLQTLLEFRADITKKSGEGKTAQTLAEEQGFADCAKLLTDAQL